MDRQASDILRDEILSGRWPDGERLATEQALAERFGVSRTTIRRTIAVLRKEGLVSVQRGKGTFVGRPHGRRPARGLETETVEALLARLASGSPAPGGGAAAALTAATAAALAGMVARITARHLSDGAVSAFRTAADEERRHATRLLDDDVAAYRAVMEARRLPSEARGGALQRALVHATEVPLELARRGRELLGLCEGLATLAWPSTRSDLDVAVTLAVAALEAAVGTARTNLGDIVDRAFTARVAAELDRLVDEGRGLRRRAGVAFAERS